MLINEILAEMQNKLSNMQLSALKEVLERKLGKESEEEYDENRNKSFVQDFLATKKFEGCSERTLERYVYDVSKMIDTLQKNIENITKEDIRGYLADYQKTHKIKNSTLDNMRRYISSFFAWLEEEEYILKSPVRKIKQIKQEKVIKEPLSEVDIEKIKEETEKTRDLAIIEVLYSTGARISELVGLNRNDINNGEAVIHGKGGKERKVYFTDSAMYYLEKYLESRDDKNEALFVSMKSPHERLSINSIEALLRNLGKQANVENVHPHRFRRTMATRALNKGMPLQEVSILLGHSKLETTMIYCVVDQDNVKMSHKKYIA